MSTASADQSLVDIAFDCLPLRSLARLDVPLDASEALRERAARLQAAYEAYGAERTYYLYNARCVYHFANSEVEGSCRFEFEGVVCTDAGDRKCIETHVDVRLVSETCGGTPAAVAEWLMHQVQRAVAIEFDRFIAAGQLAASAAAGDAITAADALAGPGGMGV
ncbi:MAG: hypothetical protein IT424_16195 [Pirellulales bacterium]|nr:hypothetical protein [Pirellulales bacterium]